MRFSRLILVFVLTLTLLSSAAPQQPDQKSRKPKAQPERSREAEELRLSALSLLHSLSQSANEISDVSDRVTVLAEIGDAFWLVDSEYARTVLLRAFKEIDKLIPGVDGDRERVAGIKRNLRSLVLARLAKYEPLIAIDLTQDLANELPTPDEKAMKMQGIASPKSEAVLSVAENLLQSSSKQAAAMAVYSLPEGLSQRFRLFLIQLRAKDSSAADGLVAVAVSEVSRQHPARLFDVMVLWDYAYQPEELYFNNISWDRETNAPRINVALDLKRQILKFAVTAIIENMQQLSTADSNPDRVPAGMELGALHSVIQQLLPSMQVDFPTGAADLQQSLARVEQELRAAGQSPPLRPQSEDPVAKKTYLEKLLDAAAQASQGDGRDNLYLAAVFNLYQQRQYQKGKEIASKIDSPDKQAMILEPLNFRLVFELVTKKNLQDAWNIANQLKKPEFRISALARVGRAFLESGDSQSGMEALNAAQSIAAKADPTVEVAAATLRVASAFSKNDSMRSAEVIRLAIEIVNKVAGNDTLWSLVSSSGAEDALFLVWKYEKGSGISSVNARLPRVGGLANTLSKLDFNQAISLAKLINQKPLSIFAQARVCRTAIESIEKKD